MKSETKAVSTIVMILLILISAVIGAAISYMWVMGSYFNMPENATLLFVENVSFPSNDFTYFNVTVLNLSNSISDANVTSFRLYIESRNETQFVETAEPGLPFIIGRGTRQDFRCLKNWSNITGETVRVEPVAGNVSIKSDPYDTPNIKLTISPNFDSSESIEYFNLTVQNFADQNTSLTISEIMISIFRINSTSPALPLILPANQTAKIQCYWNWANYKQNVTVTVKTTEGYETVFVTSEVLGAALYISDVTFNYADSTCFNLTVRSSEDSTATVTINSINLTLQGGTPTPISTRYLPLGTLFSSVMPNASLTLVCDWNWTQLRNESITIEAFTNQGFMIQSKTVRTPLIVVWNITEAQFDLGDMEHFSVNITNMLCSYLDINVTKIEFNQNVTTSDSTLIAAGNQTTLICGFNWTDFVGENVTITAYVSYDSTESVMSYSLRLPHLKITNASFSNFPPGNPSMEITVLDSAFSKINATVTQIFVKLENGTLKEPGINPQGYSLVIGTETSIVCLWPWNEFVGNNVTVIVKTSDGLQTSTTLKVK